MGLREEYLEEITSQEGIREGFASGEGIKSGREKAEGISFWRELDFGSGKCRRELALFQICLQSENPNPFFLITGSKSP